MANDREKSCVESTGIFWREPANVLPESILDFAQETSLHGVKYVCQTKRHLCERIFWIFTLIGGGIAAGVLIRDLWIEYSHQPVLEWSIEQIPFPTVTIFNSNLVRKTDLETAIKQAKRVLASYKNKNARTSE